MVVNRREVNFFYQMEAPVPEIMDGSLYNDATSAPEVTVMKE
jgi:hypothetical protein